MNTPSQPHPSHLIDQTLAALIRATAGEAETLGQLPPAQLEILHQQQWLHMLVPKVYGGSELSLPQVLQTEEALAYIDGSLAWVVTLCSGAGLFTAYLEPLLAAAVQSDPFACIAGSGAATGTAEIVEAGYRINGQWKYASGAIHATAFTANCVLYKNGQPLLQKDGTPTVKAFLFKKNEVQLLPSWKAMGMIATGSHAFEVKDLIIPGERSFLIEATESRVDGPLYRYPFLQLAQATLTVNLSGMAARFVDLVQERTGPGGRMAVPCREASEQFENSRMMFYAEMEASWEALLLGAVPGNLLETVSNSCHQLVGSCRKLMGELYPYAGMEAADTRTELNRTWRNFHTATQHALFYPGSWSISTG